MSLETVSFQSRTLVGTSTTYTGVLALPRMTAGSLAGVGGQGAQVTERTNRWHIEASTLAVTPKRGDRIVSAISGTWEILTVDLATFSTRHACNTKHVTGP